MRETRFEWNIERDTTDTILPSQLPTQAQTVETNKEVNQKKKVDISFILHTKSP